LFIQNYRYWYGETNSFQLKNSTDLRRSQFAAVIAFGLVIGRPMLPLLRTCFVPASEHQQMLNRHCTVVDQTPNRKYLVNNGSILIALLSISEGGPNRVRTQAENSI